MQKTVSHETLFTAYKQADVFALGATIFSLVCEQMPHFTGMTKPDENWKDYVINNKKAGSIAVSEGMSENVKVTEGVKKLLDKMLAFDRNDRASVEELLKIADDYEIA